MQRTAIVAATGALSAVLLLGLAGCSAGFNGDDGANGGGTPATSPVSQPGRYSGLPEPCGTPDQDRLRDLLPGAGSEALAGETRVTYDTGRRAACDWSSEAGGTSYQLSVDFLRTISYDPEISDNDRAALDFAARAERAAIPRDAEGEPDEDDRDREANGDGGPGASTGPDGGESSGDTPGADPGAGNGDGTDPDADADPDPGEDADQDMSPAPDAELDGVIRPVGEYAPRMLSGIGHAAYIDDRLSADGTRREISLVFHTSNVIVAIQYTESVEESGQGLGSAVLQELARALARQVAGRLED